ncbi:hypothetical protein GCM10027168_16660 [Streptomyces capparidis]
MGWLSDVTPDFVEDAVEDGAEKLGEGIDWAGDKVAGGLDRVGWESGANWVREKSDSAANRLGAKADELQLGQTDDPKKLVHGSVGKIRSTVSHLRDFQKAFDKVGNGLKGMDSSRWRGRTADAFRDKVAVEPAKWFKAADAFEKAADAMDRFADTVEWAQKQAQEAIDKYNEAKKASEDARTAHNAKVDAYNDAADAYNKAAKEGKDPGEKPVRPGEFKDPGEAIAKAAQEKLDAARRQRDEAAETARTAVRTARDAAPDKPSYTEQLADAKTNFDLDALHFTGGIVKGGAGLVSFARSVNILDPYNLTHPAEYLTNLNSTVAGLAVAVNDPAGTGKDMLNAFMKDPAEGLGKLVPELIGTKGLGAARKTASAARHAPDGAGRRTASDGPGQHNKGDKDRCCGGTDPVDLATGKMFLTQTDVVLPGVLPLVFTRRVESGYRAGRWFGPSWSSTVDQRLEIDAKGVVLLTEDGLALAYPHPVPGVPTLPETGPRRPLERTPEGDYTLTDPDTGHTRHFSGPPGGGDGEARIDQITDRNGNWITFDHDPHGAPTAITHSGGYRLLLTTEDARVTALHLAGAADGGGDAELARYGYTDGNLTELTDSSGLPMRFGYDDRARVIHWTDTNDRRYDYAYDDQDRCVAEGGEAGHIALRITYDTTDPATGHRVTAVTTPEGHTTRYLVNDLGQVVAEIDPLGGVTRTEYDALDRLLAHTDPLGNTTRFRYDDEGNPVSLVRPDGAESTAEYNALGLPTTVTAPDGGTWHQEYDEAGNRTSLTDPTGATTRYTYDDRGRLTSVTDALGHTTTVRSDAAGLPVAVTDPLGSVTTYRRDAFGRVTEITDPLGHTTRLEWNARGKPLRRVHPDGAEESWTYDGEGNCTSYTDPVGAVTRCEYTHFDLLAARTGPDGVRHTFEHDARLRLTRVTNPLGLTWEYTYDAAGRLTRETDFDGRTLTYTHDAAGRLATRTNGLGQTVAYTRDAMGRTVAKEAGGRTTTYTYGPAGDLTQAACPDAELLYRRDRLGRVKSETCNGRTLTFSYDALGRRTRRITPMGSVSDFRYDAAGGRAELTASGRTFRFERDPLGRETARRLGGGLTLTHTWDRAGRLTGQSLTAPTGLVQRRSYTYRPDGHLVALDDHLSGRRTFDLDATGRVTAVHAQDWTERYAYDEAGNQTLAEWPAHHPGQDATGPRSYTGTRITRAGNVHYEHDAQGRIVLRRRTRLSRKPDTWRYTWDAEDRLTDLVTPDGTRWHYLYDPLGRRIAKQRLAADGTVAEQVDFAWDGATLAEQTTTGGAAPNPVTLTWDHDGLQPVAQTERITDATSQREIDQRFFAIVTDLAGAPRELVDESGAVAWRTRGTLWGGVTWQRSATAHTPLRFPGQYHDPESGLHYNVHRYYDPETARYVSPDPLGLHPGPNHRAYVGNPHAEIDPLGLMGKKCKPRVSPVAPDWATKGAHVHIGKDEVRISVDKDGNVVGEPIRLSHGWASDKSVREAVDAVNNDPKLRADLLEKAKSAKEHMDDHNWGNKQNRSEEMQRLIDHLKDD